MSRNDLRSDDGSRTSEEANPTLWAARRLYFSYAPIQYTMQQVRSALRVTSRHGSKNGDWLRASGKFFRHISRTRGACPPFLNHANFYAGWYMKTRPEQSSLTTTARGVLIVGHGTRDRHGAAEFHQCVRQAAQRLVDVAVEPGFLELAKPSIAQAVTRLTQQGISQITVLPLLLLGAGHVKRDIPEAVAAAVRDSVSRYGEIEWRQVGHLGCHQRLLQLSAKRFHESLTPCAQRERIAEEETLLLMVGRGSPDPDATREMHEFTRLRRELTPVAYAQTCFLAMAQPSVEVMLKQVAELPCRRVVVQPHLLFRGQLLQQLKNRIQDATRQWPDRQWCVSKHLGPDSLLIDAICEMINNAQLVPETGYE